MQQVADFRPGILETPSFVWNMDETAVDCTFGKQRGAFKAAGKPSGGYRRVKSTYSVSKHITAVIATSAAGRITPPFIIVARKRRSSERWGPVRCSFKKQPSGIIARFTQENWFPGEGAIEVSENGSIEGPLLNIFIQHLDNTSRKYIGPDKHYLLCLDGHASRKHIAWLEQCSAKNIEAVVNAANTSHFLQPCD